MPFIIKATNEKVDLIEQKTNYFSEMLLLIRRKRIFKVSKFEQEALLSTLKSEAKVFVKLREALEVKVLLLKLNDYFNYEIEEVEVEKES